jgi:hypothetical protein
MVNDFHVPVNCPVERSQGFVKSVKSEGDPAMMGSDPWDVVGIDCEMVHTIVGSALARVTVIAANRTVL